MSTSNVELGMPGQPASSLKRQALVLVWIGEIWNLFEAAIGLGAAVQANSTSLAAFGLDSIVELAAGGVLIWHLQREIAGEVAREEAERKAHRLVGVTFFFLAAIVALHSVASLTGLLPEARPSTVGILLIIASAGIMTTLYVLKTNVADKMNSPALRAEAKQALFCDLQDVPVIVGLIASSFVGWWWADPLVAFVIVPLFIREGLEGWRGDSCGDRC